MTTQGFYLRLFFASLLLGALGLLPALQQSGGSSATPPSVGLLPVSEAKAKHQGEGVRAEVSQTAKRQP